MAVQSPADRLLTEAAGALVFRTAAQVDTQADARVAAMLAAQKNKPSGLAGLGPDGLVPASQLPPAAVTTIVKQRTADWQSMSTAYVIDPLLSAMLPAGTYLWESMAICVNTGGANAYGYIQPRTVAAPLTVPGQTTVDAGANASLAAPNTFQSFTLQSTSASLVRHIGVFTLAAAAAVGLVVNTQATSTAVQIKAGSWVRITPATP